MLPAFCISVNDQRADNSIDPGVSPLLLGIFTNLQNSALAHIGDVVVVQAHGFWGHTEDGRVENVNVRECNLGEKVSWGARHKKQQECVHLN